MDICCYVRSIFKFVAFFLSFLSRTKKLWYRKVWRWNGLMCFMCIRMCRLWILSNGKRSFDQMFWALFVHRYWTNILRIKHIFNCIWPLTPTTATPSTTTTGNIFSYAKNLWIMTTNIAKRTQLFFHFSRSTQPNISICSLFTFFIWSLVQLSVWIRSFVLLFFHFDDFWSDTFCATVFRRQYQQHSCTMHFGRLFFLALHREQRRKWT